MEIDNCYVAIQGWMVSKLGLKNTDLLLYALIYGFTQDGESKFHGGMSYLEKWTNATKNTIMNSLNRLSDMNLIVKDSVTIRNITYNEYSVNMEEILGCTGSKIDRVKNCTGSKIDPNNNNIYISNNISTLSNNIDNIKGLDNINNTISNIIIYLNIVLGSKFAPANKSTRCKISARLREGFTENDFKTVIDSKFAEWGNNEMRKYLRPETLFGTKFEGYLNAATVIHKDADPQKQDVEEKEEKEMSDDEWLRMCLAEDPNAIIVQR